MTQVQEAVTAIDELVVLLRKKIDLMGQLKRALLLADLMGMKPKEMTGKLRHGAYDLERRSVQRWRGFVLRVTYDGEARDFPLKDIHLDLWPADLRAEYERHRAKTRRERTHHA